MRGGPCSIEGCDQQVKHWTWCSRHYQRWRRYGDPTAGNASPVPVAEQEAFLREAVAKAWPEECIKWPYSRTNKGYGVTTLEGVRIAAHRACCKIAHGEPPSPEHQAAHSCGKGHEGCINPGHLRWATPAENAADMKQHGTAPIGAANPAATMSESLVLKIYALRGKVSQKQIAKQYGVPQPTISDIMRGNAWASVTGAIYRPGRQSGEQHAGAKLDAIKVADIRRRAGRGEQQKDIAASYRVTPQCVNSIVKRVTWAGVA